jgi:probable phosphoglycerate mutase
MALNTAQVAGTVGRAGAMQAKRGYYILNVDGAMVSSGQRAAGEPPGTASIGVVLRSPRLAVEKEISKTIGRASHNVAEYSALIAGLKLAQREGVEQIRVFTDSELVVDQMNDRSEVKSDALRPLHAKARGLAASFRTFRISWVPREMNERADELTKLALKAPRAL